MNERRRNLTCQHIEALWIRWIFIKCYTALRELPGFVFWFGFYLSDLSWCAWGKRGNHSRFESLSGTSLDILRQIRRNFRRSQASLKLVISMERELQRVARSVASHITDTVEQSPAEPLPQQQRSQKDNSQLPFSAWAGWSHPDRSSSVGTSRGERQELYPNTNDKLDYK